MAIAYPPRMDLPRRKRLRSSRHDYRGKGVYFVTICAKRWSRPFGSISAGGVRLSPIGRIVAHCWRQIGVLRPWIVVDEFVVMPDHLHGLLTFAEGWRDPLGVVLNQFKGAATRLARRSGHCFKWHRGFHERVVRDCGGVPRIRTYIRRNPELAYQATAGLVRLVGGDKAAAGTGRPP